MTAFVCTGNTQEDHVTEFQSLSCKNLSSWLSVKCRRISCNSGDSVHSFLHSVSYAAYRMATWLLYEFVLVSLLT